MPYLEDIILENPDLKDHISKKLIKEIKVEQDVSMTKSTHKMQEEIKEKDWFISKLKARSNYASSNLLQKYLENQMKDNNDHTM